MKIIDICSGKGGVGKTTVALNLAAALQKLNKRVVLVDCNLTTAHIGVMLNLFSAEKTFNNFLRGEIKLEQAVHHSEIDVVPASLELSDLANLKTDHLKDSIRESFRLYDFVILDSAPGIGKEALIPLKACDEAIFVANPCISSVVDVLKTKDLSHRIGFYNAGLIINRVRNRNYELTKDDIYNFTEMHILGMVPEDETLMRALNERQIAFTRYPRTASSSAFFEIAHRVAGFPYYGR